MERDLTDLMHAGVAAREESMADLQPGAGALAATVRSVRRRRTVRHSVQGLGVGAVAVAVAGASWFGLQRTDPPLPATTSTPSATSSPAPSATTPTPTVVHDEILGLPPTRSLPPGLLEQATPGWVLATYHSVPAGATELEPGVEGIPGGVVHTVVLVSPAGEMYRVVDLPLDMGVTILRWEAGSTTAVVRIEWVGDLGVGMESRAVLDLTSGTLTPTALGLFSSDYFPNMYVGDAADGVELWDEAASTDAIVSNLYRVRQDGSAPEFVGDIGFVWLLDPTGRWLVSNGPEDLEAEEGFLLLDVVDGGTTQLSYGVPGQRCDVVGWFDPGRLLAFCTDDGTSETDPAAANAAYYRIDVSPSGATPTLLTRIGLTDPHPTDTWSGAWVSSGTVAFAGAVGSLDVRCADDTYLWTGSSARAAPVAPGSSPLRILGGDPLLVESTTGGCTGGATAATLRAYDAASGTSAVLAPEPAPTADVPVWSIGLVSWTRGVAP
ncbi:hypothetical protein [Cellulomonas terrae]|uniref:Uncharacterized protein n=1 Tax=Cellulomonas terrae TaxID=311234 RepID=A0A511JR63_9CELL|nr:hypothetical protein [Cellulomonas terrae]GEM00316.1 hypothetical protein CTE05_38620 [Cellulomonas terrae]